MRRVLIVLVFLITLVGCSDAKKNAYDLAKKSFDSDFSDYGIPVKFPSYSKVKISESSTSELGAVYVVEGSIPSFLMEIEFSCTVPKGAKNSSDVNCSSW